MCWQVKFNCYYAMKLLNDSSVSRCPRSFFVFRIDANEMSGDEHSFLFKCSSGCEQVREAGTKKDMQNRKELGKVPFEKAKP